MRTEVVIPFAFDTSPIEKRLQEHGEEEAMKAIKEMVEDNVRKHLPKKTVGYGYDTKSEPDWRGYIDDSFTQWMNDHAEEIIDEAALLLAARAGRKATWREVLREVKEGQK